MYATETFNYNENLIDYEETKIEQVVTIIKVKFANLGEKRKLKKSYHSTSQIHLTVTHSARNRNQSFLLVHPLPIKINIHLGIITKFCFCYEANVSIYYTKDKVFRYGFLQ